MNTDRIIASVLSLVSAPLGVPFFYTGRVGLGIFCLICTFGFHDPKLPILFGVIFFIKLVLMTDERFQRKYRMSFAGKQNCKKTKVEIFRQFTPPVYVQPKEKFSRSGFEARSRMLTRRQHKQTLRINRMKRRLLWRLSKNLILIKRFTYSRIKLKPIRKMVKRIGI